jgi:hypothetical protein
MESVLEIDLLDRHRFKSLDLLKELRRGLNVEETFHRNAPSNKKADARVEGIGLGRRSPFQTREVWPFPTMP